MSTLGFSQFAEQNPGKLALAAPDGRHWSRGEVLAKCHQFAHGLRFLGIKRGDSVVAMLPNSAELIALKLAVAQIGGVLIPIPYDLNSAKAANTITSTEAGAFIAHEDYQAVARQAADIANHANCVDLAIGSIRNFLSFSSLIEIYPETAPENCRPDSQESHLFALCDIYPESNNVHFCGSALDNPRVMFWATQCLHYGHALVLTREWDALEMLQAIGQYHITTSYMFQFQFEKLLLLPFGVREQYNVSSIRRVITDAPVNDPQINRAMNLWWRESIYAFYSAELDYTNSSALSRQAAAEIGKLCNGYEKNTQQFSESTDQPPQKLTMKRH